MGKGQVWGLILLLAVTAAVIGAARLWPAERMDEPPESESVPLAENACSPDGKYEVRQIDGGGDGEIVPSMETVQVVDRATGEVLWEDSGGPDGGIRVFARGGVAGRGYAAVPVSEHAGGQPGPCRPLLPLFPPRGGRPADRKQAGGGRGDPAGCLRL